MAATGIAVAVGTTTKTATGIAMAVGTTTIVGIAGTIGQTAYAASKAGPRAAAPARAADAAQAGAVSVTLAESPPSPAVAGPTPPYRATTPFRDARVTRRGC